MKLQFIMPLEEDWDELVKHLYDNAVWEKVWYNSDCNRETLFLHKYRNNQVDDPVYYLGCIYDSDREKTFPLTNPSQGILVKNVMVLKENP